MLNTAVSPPRPRRLIQHKCRYLRLCQRRSQIWVGLDTRLCDIQRHKPLVRYESEYSSLFSCSEPQPLLRQHKKREPTDDGQRVRAAREFTAQGGSGQLVYPNKREWPFLITISAGERAKGQAKGQVELGVKPRSQEASFPSGEFSDQR